MPGDSREQLCRIADLLDALQCGALLIDRAGTIVHINERLATLCGRSAADMAGMRLDALYADGAGREAIDQVLANFEEPTQREFYLPRIDGERVPVLAAGRQLSGEPPLSDHRLVTMFDLSPQKQAEVRLAARYKEVAQLTDTVLEQALELKRYSQTLESKVRDRTRELHEANLEAIFMLAVASEAKDADTGAHVRRIQGLTETLAIELGLSEAEARELGYAAILHDVGKMQVPDDIIHKPASLSEHEWDTMRRHTIVGEHILSKKPFFAEARRIARSHHENWDGSGYPDGLAGDAIPLSARIVHVADVYDALTSHRPYKLAWLPEDAAEWIRGHSGVLFDPAVVAAFDRVFRAGKLAKIRVHVDAQAEPSPG